MDIEATDTEEAEDTEEEVDMGGEEVAEEEEGVAADPAKNPAVNWLTSAQIFQIEFHIFQLEFIYLQWTQ